MNFCVYQDHRTNPTDTQAAGGNKCPLIVRRGLAWLKIESSLEGNENFSSADNMAGSAFTKLDDMPTVRLRGEHPIKGGNGRNFLGWQF
jgi:hypothetical protein